MPYQKKSEKKYHKDMPLTQELKESHTFQTTYGRFYKNPCSVIWTRIKESLDECGFSRKGLYMKTDGVSVHYRSSISKEHREEFQKRLIDLVSEYEDVIQISLDSNMSLTNPEHLRWQKVFDFIIKSNNSTSRRERKVKQFKNRDKDKFTRYINRYTKEAIVRTAHTCYGEYHKNSEGVELIYLIDDSKRIIENQNKVVPKELFEHFLKHELITFTENRDTYKKFYFTQKFLENKEKYINIKQKNYNID